MKPKYTIPTQLSRQRERFGVEHNSAYWFAVDKYRGLIVACCRHVAKAHCSHETDGTKEFSWEHEKSCVSVKTAYAPIKLQRIHAALCRCDWDPWHLVAERSMASRSTYAQSCSNKAFQ